MATTIAVLPEAELQDGQMKEVDFGDGKVLLSRLGDKIHATSAFCTHYGAPLAKGVLAADGRVTCPWHGACFNVCTGDIEDAPAPDALHTFSVKVADGHIQVTAHQADTQKANMARPPKLAAHHHHGHGHTGHGVVIVGGGSATFYTIESLRENGYKGPITVLTKEKHMPVDRTKLSKALISDPSKLEFRTASVLKIQYGTNIRVGVTVTSINFDAKHVILEDGKETVAYEKLVLAPGGIPRVLPIPGASAHNVFTLRHLDDAKKIDAAAQEGKRMVVIGSSFIAMELVAAVSKRKLASIDVIGMDEVPFENVLGREVGAALLKYHESQGVKFHLKTKSEKIVTKEDDETVATGVIVNGETLPCDFVLMAVGVAPATKFLQTSGVPTERDGGVRVDHHFKLAGYEDVYAVGDIAHYPQHVTGELRRIEHWNVAGNHGRAVGKTIAGHPQPFTKVPYFWSAQGQNIRYCGSGMGFEEVFISGDVEQLKFVAYYIKSGKVVAVASMQCDPVVSVCSELLRFGLMPSPEELRAGVDPCSVDISTVASVKKLQLSFTPHHDQPSGTMLVGHPMQPLLSQYHGAAAQVLPTPPVTTTTTRKRKRAHQYTVSYSEVQEVDSDGRLREVIVIEDTPPPPTTLSPSIPFSASYQPPVYSAPIRTRARAAAEAAGSSSSAIVPPPAKKRKRDVADDVRAPVAKKVAAPVAQTKSYDSRSAAATDEGPAQCDDKEGHYIIQPDDLIYRRYRTVKLLGQGTFGKVVEAVDTHTDTRVAIKIIRAIPKYRDASKIEVRVLNKLKERDPLNRHKCIHLLHWFDHKNHICLVSELLGMCLYDFLKENDFAPFPRHHIQSFARQLLGSVAFLHDLHLIHTDLKPENILLVKNDYKNVHISVPGKRNAPPKVKRILNNVDIRLIDFGSATFENEYHSTVVCTRHYRAPEIILGLGWSYPCDAYSLGCILVEFFTGVALFQTHDNLEHLAMMEMVMGKMPERFARSGSRTKPEFFKDGVRLDWPKAKASRQSKKDVRATRPLSDVIPPNDVVNRHFLNLVQKLLAFDPAQRITVREALNHPYFNLAIAPEI
uniref:Uncharacterized protein n=1 Tax=Mycena chlorophos TaxID=658473 RepID=A0ABQ0MCE9_MYCCL|nr:predicted protein [Mycena chlorophos]